MRTELARRLADGRTADDIRAEFETELADAQADARNLTTAREGLAAWLATASAMLGADAALGELESFARKARQERTRAADTARRTPR